MAIHQDHGGDKDDDEEEDDDKKQNSSGYAELQDTLQPHGNVKKLKLNIMNVLEDYKWFFKDDHIVSGALHWYNREKTPFEHEENFNTGQSVEDVCGKKVENKVFNTATALQTGKPRLFNTVEAFKNPYMEDTPGCKRNVEQKFRNQQISTTIDEDAKSEEASYWMKQPNSLRVTTEVWDPRGIMPDVTYFILEIGPHFLHEVKSMKMPLMVHRRLQKKYVSIYEASIVISIYFK